MGRAGGSAPSGGRQIFEGLDPDDGPIAWESHPDYPSIGTYSQSDDMTGGMGYEGLSALKGFVEDGCTLITLGSTSTVPAEFAIVSSELGEGRIVMFGVRALHRNQTQGPFGLVWKAIVNWDRIDPVAITEEEGEEEAEVGT